MSIPTTPEQAAAVIVNVLTKAIPHLAHGWSADENSYTHICNAIGRSSSSYEDEHFTREYIMRGINNDKPIHRNYAFTDWLDNTHGSGFTDSHTYEQIQALRHRWVRKLIRDLTKKYLT